MGKLFTVPFVAVDQVNNTVPDATICSYTCHVEDCQREKINFFRALKFWSFSLTVWIWTTILHADGPCKNAPLSWTSLISHLVTVQIETCRDKMWMFSLRPYILDCDPKAETITREGDFWADFVSESRCYLVHHHCPLAWLLQTIQSRDQDKFDGADAQCTNNCSGILCGQLQCSIGTSVSIGSSHITTGWKQCRLDVFHGENDANIFTVRLVI